MKTVIRGKKLPIKLTITLESDADLLAFWHIYNINLALRAKKGGEYDPPDYIPIPKSDPSDDYLAWWQIDNLVHECIDLNAFKNL